MTGHGAEPDDSPVAGATGVPPGLIRGALQLALRVARDGLQAEPPVEPPRSVARMLAFNRHPDAALVTVRRSLDSDEAFRSRVAAAAAADDHGLDPPSLLFLTRPPGWEAELGQLAAQTQAAAAAAQEEREERHSRRRLAKAEAALRQAEQARARAEQRATRAEAALEEDRRRRRSAEEGARHSLEKARAELRAEVRAETETATNRAERAAAEADALRARVASLERELALTNAAPPFGAAAEQALRAALAAVTAAGQALEGALGEISRTGGPRAPSMADRAPGSAGSPAPPESTGRRPAPRRPAALPPGVFDDSVEAADHLVRVPGILLLVDGYNVAMYCWPDNVAPAELRRRLVAALQELATRAGTAARVVWDSSEAIERSPTSAPRRLVREVFSPPDPDIEADDIILAEVSDLPAGQPVVVASSDRRVAEGARRLGANVISSAQLAAVLGRRPA